LFQENEKVVAAQAIVDAANAVSFFLPFQNSVVILLQFQKKSDYGASDKFTSTSFCAGHVKLYSFLSLSILFNIA